MGPPNQSLPTPNSKENSPLRPPAVPRRNLHSADINPRRTTSPSPEIVLYNNGRIRLDDEDEKPSYTNFLGQRQQRSEIVGERQFNMLRDSLVFNHERLIQDEGLQRIPEEEAYRLQNRDDSQIQLPTPAHYPSLHEMNPDGSNNFLEDPSLSQSSVGTEVERSLGIPKLYSVPNSGQREWRNESHQKTNFVELMSSKNKPSYLFSGSEGKALSGTAASLHLPNSRATPLPGGDAVTTWNEESGTTVTTAYSYKCDRSGRQRQVETVLSAGMTPAGIEVKDSSVAEMTLIPQRTPKEEEDHQFMMTGNTKILEATDTETNLTMTPLMVGDYATGDEDLDDDFAPIRQLPPFFPNPDDLKYPDPMNVRMNTHPKYHPFVSTTYKKDCRTWLYKNVVGRKARQLLAGSSSNRALSSSGQRQTQTQPQPRRQIQSFDNPPDATTIIPNNGSNIMKAFAENDDEHQMLVDNDSEGLIRVPPMRDAGGAGAATATGDIHSTNPFNNLTFK